MKFTRPFIASSVLIAATAAAFVGCDAEDTGSSNVKTAGIHAIYEAVASGDGTTQVRAELRVGGDDGTYLFLDGGDRLVAMADQDGDGEPDSVDMRHNSSGDRHWYLSRFETDEDDTEFTIEFLRGDDGEDAVNSSVTLPPGFTMGIWGLDSEGETIQRGNDVTVTWDNLGGGTINWEIDGDCIWPESGNTPDDGELTIPAEDIEVQSLDEGETCTVEVVLERTREGSVDSAFGEGGTFWGIQRRGFEFQSTPADGEGEDGGGAGGAGGSGN